MEASYDDIMDALETQYDDITETEALLSKLFSTTQGEKESVAKFGGWLHSIAHKIRQSQGTREEEMMMSLSKKNSSEA